MRKLADREEQEEQEEQTMCRKLGRLGDDGRWLIMGKREEKAVTVGGKKNGRGSDVRES